MIKISKNSSALRLVAAISCCFPAFLALLIALFNMDDTHTVLIALLVIVVVVILSVFINYFDYEIFFDPGTQMIIVKRYGKEYTFAASDNFAVTPYIFPISFGLQYYCFKVSNKSFRFKYLYIKNKFSPIIILTDVAKDIEKQIKAQISSPKGLPLGDPSASRHLS